jgi:hypothetical protein
VSGVGGETLKKKQKTSSSSIHHPFRGNAGRRITVVVVGVVVKSKKSEGAEEGQKRLSLLPSPRALFMTIAAVAIGS